MLQLATFPQAHAETFKNSEFLKWERKTGEFYLDANVGMLGMIASMNDRKQQKCLEDWYLDDKRKSIDAILKTMEKFPDHHPRAVIIALLEKHCGSFVYRR